MRILESLSEFEVDTIKNLVNKRRKYNEEHPERNTNNYKGSLESDFIGLGGEFAFCKIINIYPELEYTTRIYYDCKLPDGSTVDVKTTSNPKGNLIIPAYKKGQEIPDYYAFLIQDKDNINTFQLIGLIESGKVFQRETETMNNNKVYRIPNNELVIPKDLIRLF
jgi:hypothetical protein